MKRSELFFTLVRVPTDYLSLLAAGIVAYYSRFHPLFTTIRPVIFTLTLSEYLKIVTPSLLLWITSFAIAGLYSTKHTAFSKEVSRIVFATSTAFALAFSWLFFSRTLFESRFIALVAWGLAITFVIIARGIIRLLQRFLARAGVGVYRVALIGPKDITQTLTDILARHPSHRLRVTACFANFSPTTEKKLRTLKEQGEVDEIFLADPSASKETTLNLIAFTDTEHLGFRYSADLFATAIGRSVFHMYSGIPVIEVRKTPLDGWGAIYKRCFDIFGSLCLIILTLPIMVMTAVAIVLDSGFPIFWSKLDDGSGVKRIGQRGVPFGYFKFRSMKPGTHLMRYHELAAHDTRQGPLVKTKNDPRITRVGAFIRALSIDELPEFFLVLKGDMSLVGPRPHLPEEVARYKPEHRKVLTIKPGITGLAQISGRAHLPFDEEVRLDTYYIEHWSPFFDLIILFKTPMAVFSRKGAG